MNSNQKFLSEVSLFRPFSHVLAPENWVGINGNTHHVGILLGIYQKEQTYIFILLFS